MNFSLISPAYAAITNPAISEELGSKPLEAASGATFVSIISMALSAAMLVAALLLLLYLVYAGIKWITAGGDSAKTGKARDMITQAIIGIVVLSASLAIFMAVQNFLGIDTLKFGSKTTELKMRNPKPNQGNE